MPNICLPIVRLTQHKCLGYTATQTDGIERGTTSSPANAHTRGCWPCSGSSTKDAMALSRLFFACCQICPRSGGQKAYESVHGFKSGVRCSETLGLTPMTLILPPAFFPPTTPGLLHIPHPSEVAALKRPCKSDRLRVSQTLSYHPRTVLLALSTPCSSLFCTVSKTRSNLTHQLADQSHCSTHPPQSLGHLTPINPAHIFGVLILKPLGSTSRSVWPLPLEQNTHHHQGVRDQKRSCLQQQLNRPTSPSRLTQLRPNSHRRVRQPDSRYTSTHLP